MVLVFGGDRADHLVGGDVLPVAAERAVGGHRCVETTGAEVVDELDRLLSRVKRILGQSREFDTEAATVLFLHQVAEALERLSVGPQQGRTGGDPGALRGSAGLAGGVG